MVFSIKLSKGGHFGTRACEDCQYIGKSDTKAYEDYQRIDLGKRKIVHKDHDSTVYRKSKVRQNSAVVARFFSLHKSRNLRYKTEVIHSQNLQK